ncbi:L-alanine dehydrogenase [Thiogranum longum]|uniref:alanine dehydrogenase n=1 Tax=Thiogranum longum TaxID=1537524 RepID=A0A4R1HCK9_9GAMM|nr:alanine dehydrogenase [Thiogranum longum]TCK18293.1 L-alanine dehydrogenase [Thiogranum longum]
MHIGVPREIKPLEARVGLVPDACSELVAAGHGVFVEIGAGVPSGYPDEQYRGAGATVCDSAQQLYEFAELIVKVKEPVEGDLRYLHREHILFSYLHLAAAPALLQRLQAIGLTAIGFETVQDDAGFLPLLAPMSDIAGQLAIQLGAGLLHAPQGGKGLLIGGTAGAERGKIVVIGAGTAGTAATCAAASLGALVTVFDRKRERLEAMREVGNNVTALYAWPDCIASAVLEADLVIGAVLIPGARAPHVISAEQVSRMQAGSAIVDISVDQGGCIETTRPTDYTNPTYRVDDVVHLAVTNLPGAVPRTASQALSAALSPFLLPLANGALDENGALRRGINVRDGEICHPALLSSLKAK